MKLATFILVFIGVSAKPLPSQAMMLKPQMSQEMVLKQIIKACQKSLARRTIAQISKRSLSPLHGLSPIAAPYALDSKVEEVPTSIGSF